jgi:uncharacterized protein (DUF1697 family)
LLRGVNVGGNTLKSDRLRQLVASAGFQNVRTYIQSGNVVFETDRAAAVIAPRIEATLAKATRLPVAVFVRSSSELRRVVAGNPFANEAALDLSTLHVTFLDAAPSRESVARLTAIDAGHHRFHVAGKQIYLHCPGGYAKSKLVNNALERVLAVRATTRNWNTVRKLAELAVE